MSSSESDNDRRADDEDQASLCLPECFYYADDFPVCKADSKIESVPSNQNSEGMIVRDCLTSRSCSRKGFLRSH